MFLLSGVVSSVFSGNIETIYKLLRSPCVVVFYSVSHAPDRRRVLFEEVLSQVVTYVLFVVGCVLVNLGSRSHHLWATLGAHLLLRLQRIHGPDELT